MAIILPISITAIIFCILGIAGTIGQTMIPVITFIFNYWWIISIVFIVFSILQLLVLRGLLKYVLLLLDIPRISAMSYIIFKFAQNCFLFVNDGGIGIFFFLLEFILSGLLVMFILGYSSLKCMEATEREYIDGSSVGLYILGTLISVIGAGIYYVI